MPSEKSRRSALQRIEDILEHIADINDFVLGYDFARFVSDKKTRLAVIRALEVISEASRHLTQEIKARHPHIDWRGIAATGNIYRHGYDGIDDGFVWDVVIRDLEPLRLAMDSELRAFER